MSRFHFDDYTMQWTICMSTSQKITPKQPDSFLWHPEELSFIVWFLAVWFDLVFEFHLKVKIKWKENPYEMTFPPNVPMCHKPTSFMKWNFSKKHPGKEIGFPILKRSLQKEKAPRGLRTLNPTRWVLGLLSCGQRFCVQEAGGLRPG